MACSISHLWLDHLLDGICEPGKPDTLLRGHPSEKSWRILSTCWRYGHDVELSCCNRGSEAQLFFVPNELNIIVFMYVVFKPLPHNSYHPVRILFWGAPGRNNKVSIKYCSCMELWIELRILYFVWNYGYFIVPPWIVFSVRPKWWHIHHETVGCRSNSKAAATRAICGNENSIPFLSNKVVGIRWWWWFIAFHGPSILPDPRFEVVGW